MPTAKLNDVNLHYEVHGSGEPLVLIHGLGSSCRDWQNQVSHFAEKFQVIAPCLRGAGHSDKPPGPYSIPLFADDLLALLNFLDIDRCHLLGFSMGGAIAFQLAIDAQHRLHSLVVLNSQPSFELDHWRKHMMVISRVGMAKLIGMERMARFIAKRMFPEPGQASLRKTMLERHCDNDKESYLAALHALAGWSVKERIREIAIPTLIVAAEGDFTSIQEKQLYAEQIPNARLEVINNSRHGTLFDQPETFNALVLNFLSEQTNSNEFLARIYHEDSVSGRRVKRSPGGRHDIRTSQETRQSR